MATLQYEAYEVLKHGFGEPGAKVLIEYLDYKLDNNMEHIASKEELANEINSVRYDLTKEINLVKYDLTEKINSLKLDLTRNIYIAGLVQFLAVIGSILTIFKFMLNK